MHTVEQWLAGVVASPIKLNSWLIRQYVGERLAADRLQAFAERISSPKHKAVLQKIAEDEALHAEWVGNLLSSRGIELPVCDYADDRYWAAQKLDTLTDDELFAAGYHAETMRLARIRAICESTLPDDIRDVFQKILPMEEFHAAAFAKFASPAAIESMRDKHGRGMEALGLVM